MTQLIWSHCKFFDYLQYVNTKNLCECEYNLCIRVCEHNECTMKTKHIAIFCWVVQKRPWGTYITISKPCKRTWVCRELDQHIGELKSCMWAHKFASRLILWWVLKQRLSPTTECCETRRQEVEKLRIWKPLSLKDLWNWFGRFVKLLEVKVDYHDIESCATYQVGLEESWTNLEGSWSSLRTFMKLSFHLP